MSLRDQIDQFMANHDPTEGTVGAIDELFGATEFGDLDPTHLVDALRHYADTGSLDIADALSGLLTDQSDIPLEEFDPTTVNDNHGSLGLAGFGIGHLGSDAHEINDDVSDLSDLEPISDELDIDDVGGMGDGLSSDVSEADATDTPGVEHDDDSYQNETNTDIDSSLDGMVDEQAADELDFDF